MDESLYSRRSNLVIGFHGCDQSVVEAVIAGKTELLASTNDYDWLGNGIYFWENNEERAWQWAKDLAKRKNSQIKEPAVVGAIIDLGYCFDLTDSTYLQELKAAYESMVTVYKESGIELPKNTSIGNSTDLLKKPLSTSLDLLKASLKEEAFVQLEAAAPQISVPAKTTAFVLRFCISLTPSFYKIFSNYIKL